MRTLVITHAAQAPKELRICTNKTCKTRNQSPQILKFAQSLQLTEVQVSECGCLGHCGTGPNVAIMPKGVILNHVDSPTRVMHVLSDYFEVHVNDADVDAATGNEAARDGRLQQAIDLYSRAMSLAPAHGMHLLLANRSGARLTIGQSEGAVEDAYAALQCAPVTFSTAVVRLVDALYACQRYDEALEVLDQSPHARGFARSSDYASLRNAVEQAAAKKAAAPAGENREQQAGGTQGGWLRWGG